MIRFYYNIAKEAPLVASLDYGDPTTEIKVMAIDCQVPCHSNYGAGQVPCFWMECEGEVVLDGDRLATIKAV